MRFLVTCTDIAGKEVHQHRFRTRRYALRYGEAMRSPIYDTTVTRGSRVLACHPHVAPAVLLAALRAEREASQ